MYLLLSFIMVLIALYALGSMAEAGYESNVFTPQLVAFLMFSLISFFRSIRSFSLFDSDDYYKRSDSGTRYTHYNNYSGGHTRNNNTSTTNYTSTYVKKSDEEVTTFENKPNKRNIEKRVIKVYPDKKKVLEEIKELEKNPWWKLKRSACNLFGHDITAKMYEPIEKVEYVNKEDDTRFMPNNKTTSTTTTVKRTDYEYDNVVKWVSRSFDVAIVDKGMSFTIEEDENGTVDTEREGTGKTEEVSVGA